MRHAMKQPAQGGAFQCPTESDPLPIELDRKNQGDEKQRRTAKEGELCVTPRTFLRSQPE